MLILIALLVIVWFICVNAILLDMQIDYMSRKRKFFVKSDNLKFYPFAKIIGNGTCSDKNF